MLDTGRFFVRAAVITLLLCVPFLRLLIRENYGLFHPEIAVAILIAAAVGAALGAVARSRTSFCVLTVLVIILMSVGTVQSNFLPRVPGRWIILGLAFLLGLGVLILKQNFYTFVTVFVLGALLVDVANSALHRPRLVAARAQANGSHRLVIHLVLDGMPGLASMPANCAECQMARRELQQTFERGNFDVYPFAFSNYDSTRDSIPSILNGRLEMHQNEFVDGRGEAFGHSAYFDNYRRQGYDVRVYQSDFLSYLKPDGRSVYVVTYRANDLKALHLVDSSIPGKLARMMNILIRTDPIWLAYWERFLQDRYPLPQPQVGPLSFVDVWPGRMLDEIRAANKDTLFFAHLLTPHYPYVYRADGSIRSPREWLLQGDATFYQGEEQQYRDRYEQCGAQVRFLNTQLAAFFDSLRAASVYDSATIILHGDHGSRLQMIQDVPRPHRRIPAIAEGSVYDQTPDRRDLLDRFGTLLAVKRSGAEAPATDNEVGSVMYFLGKQRLIPEHPMAADINAAYSFGRDGRPARIPLLELWNRGTVQ